MAEPKPQSAAAAASRQVKAIVEAAERAALELEAAAKADAERIRAEAERDASRARDAAGRLAERADELERRLGALAEGVRAAVAAVRDELAELRSGESSEPGAAPSAEPEPEPDAGAADEELIAQAKTAAAREPGLRAEAGTELLERGVGAGAPAPPSEPCSAPEGARLLALKMALDGTPRDETARYLRENFDLVDPEGLLDEVYAKAGR